MKSMHSEEASSVLRMKSFSQNRWLISISS